MSNSKNDVAWEKLFIKHNIIEEVLKNGHTIISSTQINEFREARLMTKFDHKSQLPKLFSDNNFSILPTSRGGYVIGCFETFSDFNTDDIEITKIGFPTFLESLDYRNITSEATAINCALVSNILNDFTDEEELFPTVSGRMSSSSFEFDINSSKGLFKINVGNSQVEIDGGFEGNASLNLIEAKNYISKDFLIRQLYYPFKLWNGKIQKKVRPIFLTYTNGIFHLREYAFNDVNHYNSIILVKHRKYAIQENGLNIENIQEVLKKSITVKEPQIPFPQADSFERVINLCELLKQRGFLTKEQLTLDYDFNIVSRQTDYYINAGKYLGLIQTVLENGIKGCSLTKTGNQIFTLSIIERQISFIKLIVSHSVFKRVIVKYLDDGKIPTKNHIVDIMKESNLYNVGTMETYNRRASTVIGWINWIMNQIEE